MRDSSSDVQVADPYDEALADASWRLRSMAIYIDSAEKLVGQDQPLLRWQQRNAFSLVGQVCRIVAKTWSSDFASKPYRPMTPRWPSPATKYKLFRARPYAGAPSSFGCIPDAEIDVGVLPKECLLPDHFESMHDTARLLHGRLDSRIPNEVESSLIELARAMHRHLSTALAEPAPKASP